MKSALLRRFLFVVLLIGGGVLAATGSARAFDVGFVNPGFAEGGFWADVDSAMAAAAEDLGVTLHIRHGERDRFRMVEALDSLLKDQPDLDYVILVNEVLQGPKLLAMAEAAGIPAFLLLNTLTEEQRFAYGEARFVRPLWLGSLTPDNQTAGEEMARALFAAGDRVGLAEDGRFDLVALSGDNATPASLNRVSGLWTAIDAEPRARLRRIVPGYWTDARAHDFLSRYLEMGYPVDLVWAANDQMAIGAAKALRAHGLEPGVDVMLAGLNWSRQGVDMVRDGEMEMTHGGHFLAGAWALIMLFDHYVGIDFTGPQGPELRFSMSPITPANAYRFLDAFGDRDWGRVDFSAFSRTRRGADAAYEMDIENLLASVKAKPGLAALDPH